MRQPLGQHFLKTAAPAKSLVRSLQLTSSDPVIEIGPGHGELTRFLLEAPHERLIAIERDIMLAAGVVRRFADDPSLQVVHADIREALASESRGLAASWKLAGNIPYYLTSHLIRQVGALPVPPERAALLMQKEVAERIVAGQGSLTKLGAFTGAWATGEIVTHVARTAFSPPPRVDSAVLLLIRKASPVPDRASYDAFVRLAFAQPRKMLLNNLAAGMSKEIAAHLITEAGLDHRARPHDLSPDLIERLAAHLPR